MVKQTNQDVRGPLHFYILWPILAAVFPAVISIWAFGQDRRIGLILSAFTAAFAAVSLIFFLYNRRKAYKELVNFAQEYASAQNVLFRNLAVPYALLLPQGRIIWMNEAFKEAIGEKSSQQRLTIMNLFPELTQDLFPTENKERAEFCFPYDDRDYRVEISGIREDNPRAVTPGLDDEVFYAVYLYDETDLNRYIRENEEERQVTGLIYIDNFDEVMENVEEVKQSLLAALIDQKISQYLTAIDGIAKKMESDKYFIIFKQKYYENLCAEHFSILEDVKTISAGNSVAPTLSIGLGMHCQTLGQCYDYARMAIDMALGRGGDQCVVKEKDHITYFGGKTQQVGKNTRVKARVKAEALREFIMGKEQVIVMGHTMADIDSFGSAMGIYRIAKTLGRRCHIVIDEVTTSVQPFLEAVQHDPEYASDLIVSNNHVESLVDSNTVVIVVDTNRPNYTQCPELLNLTRAIVVLDHHRAGEEAIRNAVLSYIEPNASSACEMVAEMLQYVDENIRVRAIEADCMFAGMMIDTNNFMTKTSARTFEAAAYLRQSGADVVRVRKMFREDLESYQAKAATIRHAEVYRRAFAIAAFPEDMDVPSPTIIGAQAANEMLDIKGIKASFVLTLYHDKIYVSARSIDEVNVQLLMERMGGGGHISTAGAQIHHTDMPEAIAALKQTIDEMIEGGEIE